VTDEEVLELAAQFCDENGTEHEALLALVFRAWKLSARMDLTARAGGRETLALAMHVIATQGGKRSQTGSAKTTR
jgi:hypothetical protein